MNKKLVKLLTFVLSVCSCASLVACGKKQNASDSPDALDIYCLYKGYADDWLTSNIELFKQQDWVKEKYPNLAITYTTDASDSMAAKKLSDGPAVNSYDLLFSVNVKEYESTGKIADLTDSVYLAEVPGEEGTKVIDKIPQQILNQMNYVNAPARTDGNKSYYGVNYVDGFFGMLYNHDLLVETLGCEIPLTTEQFLSTAATIQSTKYDSNAGAGQDTVVINCADNNYWNSSFKIWWIQYSGLEAYYDYYDGYDPIEAQPDSRSVLDQKGRLRALESMEDILTAYQYAQSQTVDYKQAQTRFLEGIGIFHYNGDYFASEMKSELSYYEKENKRYDIRFMKMPVISSIVENLEMYTDGETPYSELSAEKKATYDEKLQTIIKDVDEDKLYDDSAAKAAGISENDFDYVAAARCVCGNATASGQVAVVPEYSPAKDLAADFLRFMYTDVAIRNFTMASSISFPTTYDIMGDEELFNAIDPIQQSKLKLTNGTANYPYTILPAGSSLRLGTAGLKDITYKGKFEINFAQAEGNRMSAAQILAEEKNNEWNETKWSQMVASALW